MTESPPITLLMSKILDHLTDEGELDLMGLKGHLILEEEITKGISFKLQHPQYLKDSRHSFQDLLILFKCHYFDQE